MSTTPNYTECEHRYLSTLAADVRRFHAGATWTLRLVWFAGTLLLAAVSYLELENRGWTTESLVAAATLLLTFNLLIIGGLVLLRRRSPNPVDMQRRPRQLSGPVTAVLHRRRSGFVWDYLVDGHLVCFPRHWLERLDIAHVPTEGLNDGRPRPVRATELRVRAYPDLAPSKHGPLHVALSTDGGLSIDRDVRLGLLDHAPPRYLSVVLFLLAPLAVTVSIYALGSSLDAQDGQLASVALNWLTAAVLWGLVVWHVRLAQQYTHRRDAALADITTAYRHHPPPA